MSLAHYLLQVNIYLIVFYGFYKLLLDKETYFVLNRTYLLMSSVLSLTIPFLRFEWFNKQVVAKSIYVGVDQLNNFVSFTVLDDASTSKFHWGNALVALYGLGILFCGLKLVYQLLAIKKLVRNIKNGTAFSFFNKKVISPDVPQLEIVTLHEDIHVKQLHSLDVIFFEILGIFTWFNPIIYAYKKTIKNIHEYLADEAAAKYQGDKDAYTLLLLSQAFGIESHTLTNSFFTKSIIKKRVFMLHKKRSKKVAILKYGLFVPLFALTLILSSATIRKNRQIWALANNIPLENFNDVVNEAIATPLEIVDIKHIIKDTTTALLINEAKFKTEEQLVQAEYENANTINVFYSYLANRIKYPVSAREKKIQGNSIVNFTVKNGNITDAEIQNGIGEGCDEAVLEQILSYHGTFQKDGDYSLKVSFKLMGVDGEVRNENAIASSDYIPLQNLVVTSKPIVKETEVDKTIYNFISVEQPPSYPGGIDQFYLFLAKNIRYPQAAIDNEVRGNVYVSFNVEKDGSITNINIERKLGYGTDEEAVRVLKTMRKWIPASQNGKPVRVKYNIPIKFAIDGDQNERKNKVVATVRLKNYAEKDEPLVIVDGTIKTYSYVKNMDQKDISSIDVITGPNAMSTYGKAAINGAVVVKTKSAKSHIITATLMNRN